MQKQHPYPTTGFYVAHKLFRTQGWGDLLDGPEGDDENVIERIIEGWRDEDEGPCPQDLRVWYVSPEQPAENVTIWACRAVADRVKR